MVTPSLVDPVDCKLLGRVESDKVIQDTTPASRKKTSTSEDTPKAKKKSKPCKASADEFEGTV